MNSLKLTVTQDFFFKDEYAPDEVDGEQIETCESERNWPISQTYEINDDLEQINTNEGY